MSWLVTQLDLNGAKKFWIADNKIQLDGSGNRVDTPGKYIELKNLEYIVTDKERASIQQDFGVDVIAKLMNTLDYKGERLTVRDIGENKEKYTKEK